MKKIRIFIPIVFSFCVILLYFFKRIVYVKFYPPMINFFIFFVFFLSIFKNETIIQKFAKIIKKNLCQKELDYTRKLTYVWCVFLFINFMVSLLTIFLTDKIWFIYNGFVSYFLIGLVFVIEYIVRIIFRKKNNIC